MNKKILVLAFLALMIIAIAPNVTFALSGRFDGLDYVYIVTTQADVDALPADIDALGYDIGILVDGDNLVLDGFEVHDATQFGIAVDSRSNVIVTGCTVFNIGDHTGPDFTPTGSQHGTAIYYYASSGEILENDVSEYQKGGIVANLPYNDEKVLICDNTVTGLQPVTYIAQNGIQIGYDAEAVVMRNTVDGNWYTGANWASTGILIFEASNAIVQGNLVEDNQIGIAVETWGWYGSSLACNNKIVKNTIMDGEYGITISAYDLEDYYGPTYAPEDNPIADNNKVTNNIIQNMDEAGVVLTNFDSLTTNDYDTSVDNTKVVKNYFDSAGTEIVQDMDTATKVHANVIV
jgi:hypothetical protein